MENKITVTILQPSYIPWIGYFDQIQQSDVFVFFDDVQYTRRDWRNRNRIKNSKGEAEYLTIPVKSKGNYYSKINDINIFPGQDWVNNHIKSIQTNYAKAKYFSEYFPLIKSIIKQTNEHLSIYSENTTTELCSLLGMKLPQFYVSSSLGINYIDPTDHLVQICKKFNATHYLSGSSARSYICEDVFESENITLKFQDYSHPTYNQLWGDFVPYLSIIDLLLNEGPSSLKILSSVN